MGKVPSAPKSKPLPTEEGKVALPAENVEILEEILGIDLRESKDLLVARLTRTVSRSHSPYTSAEMLDEYVLKGMPEVKERALDTIDEERKWRHAREEQEQNHDHWLDRDERAQQRRSQRNAFLVACFGIVGTLVAGYFGVPTGICITVAIAAIAGPPGATIISRKIDSLGKLVGPPSKD